MLWSTRILHRPPSAVGQGAGAWAHRRLQRTETGHRQARATEARRAMTERPQRGWRQPQVPPLRFAPVGMTNLWVQLGMTNLRERPRLLVPERRMTTPSRPYLARLEICRPTGWPVLRAAAYPAEAAWFQRPSQHTKHRAWTVQRQPEKQPAPASAARGRTRWPCEPT